MKAMEMKASEIKRTETHYLIFEIGAGYYGIEVLHVHEIFRILETETVPDSPGFLRGTVFLRGKDVPVIDLRKLFGCKDDDGPETCIVFAEYNGAASGFVVDNICEVVSVSLKDIEVTRGGEGRNNFVNGIVNNIDIRNVSLINMEKILFVEENLMVS
jgi:chemotaxis signal transduction protein